MDYEQANQNVLLVHEHNGFYFCFSLINDKCGQTCLTLAYFKLKQTFTVDYTFQ